MEVHAQPLHGHRDCRSSVLECGAVGPTETAVQRALDQALEDSQASALSRAGRAAAVPDHEALRFCLELLTGLMEATRVLAAAVDELRNDESRRPGEGRRLASESEGASSTRPDYVKRPKRRS